MSRRVYQVSQLIAISIVLEYQRAHESRLVLRMHRCNPLVLGLTILGFVNFSVSEVDEGGQLLVGDKDNVATTTAVAPVRSAKSDEFFPSKAHSSAPAIARADADTHFIYESN